MDLLRRHCPLVIDLCEEQRQGSKENTHMRLLACTYMSTMPVHKTDKMCTNMYTKHIMHGVHKKNLHYTHTTQPLKKKKKKSPESGTDDWKGT